MYKRQTGAAACLVLMLSVNFGSYALKKKSFFEVVRDEVGRTKVTVTGNVDGIDDNSTGTVKCNNWVEAEKEIGEKILKPSYIPNGFNLEKIDVVIGTVKKAITAFYSYNGNHIKFDINIYEDNYYENVSPVSYTHLPDQGLSSRVCPAGLRIPSENSPAGREFRNHTHLWHFK